MAVAVAREGGESLDKHRFRSPEAVDAAHSPDPKVRGMLRDYERPRAGNREGKFTRPQTRGRLVGHHWELVKRGVFGSKYAAQVVHSYMCMNPRSDMPVELRDKWRAPVPGVQAIAEGTCMEPSYVRRCMKILAEWKLIDISDGYDHPRLLSFDEESERDRQMELARLRGWPRPGEKRTVQVTAATATRSQAIEDETVLRERA